MAITGVLAPEPFWIIINNEGTVAGGAKMYTKRSLNKVQDKIVYQDPGLTIPWTNPVIFDLNGVQGPFYWAVDSADPQELYYIYVNDADGNLIWDIDNFPSGTGGGGGDVTTYIQLTNYIANNQFIDHIPTTSTTSITDLVVAPANHKGFTPALINPVVTADGVVGPDTRFMKNSTANTDNISFPLFIFGSDPLTGDITPVDYLKYECTTGNPGELYKRFQFPVTQKVKNLAGQNVTFIIWAAVQAVSVNIKAYAFQYFGSAPTASASVRTQIGTDMVLTTTWTKFVRNVSIPSVATKTIGTANQQTDDDALYIQLDMPLNTPCEIFFTKPALYLGTINPTQDFQNYDQINSVDMTPRTGDIKVTYASGTAVPVVPGWVAMDDKSIGNNLSGATGRANQDTFQLYKTIWDGVSDTWAPVSTGRGASAVADFVANKTLTLTKTLGRALAAAGAGSMLTPRVLGENTGTETNTIARANLPDPISNTLGLFNAVNGVGTTSWVNHLNTGSGILANPGGNVPLNNMQPTSFMNVYVKL